MYMYVYLFLQGSLGKRWTTELLILVHPEVTKSIDVMLASVSLGAKTATSRDLHERKTGARYSELMRLCYFDCIRMNIIDLLHNLFLGTAKHVVKSIWVKRGTLQSGAFAKIQDTVNDMKVPAAMGRIPRKIASNFSSFTADEWKNLTLYFSLVALKDVLPLNHYACWVLFVEACHYLCTLYFIFLTCDRVMKCWCLFKKN